jgi:hypothetical protein
MSEVCGGFLIGASQDYDIPYKLNYTILWMACARFFCPGDGR